MQSSTEGSSETRVSDEEVCRIIERSERKDYIGTLLLDAGSNPTPKDVKRAFKVLSIILHPDKNGGSATRTNAFVAISAAKEYLLRDTNLIAEIEKAKTGSFGTKTSMADVVSMFSRGTRSTTSSFCYGKGFRTQSDTAGSMFMQSHLSSFPVAKSTPAYTPPCVRQTRRQMPYQSAEDCVTEMFSRPQNPTSNKRPAAEYYTSFKPIKVQRMMPTTTATTTRRRTPTNMRAPRKRSESKWTLPDYWTNPSAYTMPSAAVAARKKTKNI